MNLTVQLTEACIASGVPDNCSHCPAALAVADAFAAAEIAIGGVETNGITIDVWAPNKAGLLFTALVPEPLQRFIDAFDDERPVKPLAVDVQFEPAAANA